MRFLHAVTLILLTLTSTSGTAQTGPAAALAADTPRTTVAGRDVHRAGRVVGRASTGRPRCSRRPRAIRASRWST